MKYRRGYRYVVGCEMKGRSIISWCVIDAQEELLLSNHPNRRLAREQCKLMNQPNVTVVPAPQQLAHT